MIHLLTMHERTDPLSVLRRAKQAPRSERPVRAKPEKKKSPLPPGFKITPKVWTPERQEELRQILADPTHTCKDAARIMGMTVVAIYNAVQRFEIPYQPEKAPVTEEELARICHYADNRYTQQEAADAMGVTYARVKDVASRHRISFKKKGKRYGWMLKG
jgi:transposase